MKAKFAIIGGGTAGLCAAVRLCELGEEPLLIEGGTYPAHKICGEFFSPECLQILKAWNINPIPIPKATFITSRSCATFSFPSPAGGMSHSELDLALVKFALAGGAKIKTNTKVTSFQPKLHHKDPHLIHLSTQELIEASHVIIATGRIPSYSAKIPAKSYMGFKAHFDDLPSDGSLEMFSFPGAYLGIAPVGNNTFNIACLAKFKNVEEYPTPHNFIENLISQHPSLHTRLCQGKNLFDHWMTTSLPAFGIKQTPDWLDTYFIGDAAVTIPPACGNGLSMAIFGGRLSGDYAVKQRASDFKKMWIKRCSSQVFWAKILHKIMLNPLYANPLIKLSHSFPFIHHKLFERTRQLPEE